MNVGLALRGALLVGAAAIVAFLLGGWAGPRPASFEFLILVVVTAVGALLGAVAFLSASRTVRVVSETSELLAAGQLARRARSTSAVTGDLTRNFNHMAARMQDLFESTVAEQHRIEAVFNSSTDAMVALARDTTVRLMNAAALQVFGVTREFAVGRPFIESARDYELDAIVREAISRPAAPPTRVITYGANRTPLRAGAVPIEDGGDWAVLLLLVDLTEIQRVDQVRRDFLGNVSHELRTPLAATRALAETLESGAVDTPEDTAEFLRRIRLQVERMTLLVNELLDLSRIESGAVELRPEALDVHALLVEAASLHSVRSEQDQITIRIPPATNIVVEGDRTSLLRTLSNLLDNAIKYSLPGSTIYTDARDEGEVVAISVKDEGPGISEQEIPRVFERFYKGDPSRSGSGVGLGLAIVKHIVRAHRGAVAVESSLGQGATFTIRLPRKFVGSAASANAIARGR